MDDDTHADRHRRRWSMLALSTTAELLGVFPWFTASEAARGSRVGASSSHRELRRMSSRWRLVYMARPQPCRRRRNRPREASFTL